MSNLDSLISSWFDIEKQAKTAGVQLPKPKPFWERTPEEEFEANFAGVMGYKMSPKQRTYLKILAEGHQPSEQELTTKEYADVIDFATAGKPEKYGMGSTAPRATSRGSDLVSDIIMGKSLGQTKVGQTVNELGRGLLEGLQTGGGAVAGAATAAIEGKDVGKAYQKAVDTGGASGYKTLRRRIGRALDYPSEKPIEIPLGEGFGSVNLPSPGKALEETAALTVEALLDPATIASLGAFRGAALVQAVKRKLAEKGVTGAAAKKLTGEVIKALGNVMDPKFVFGVDAERGAAGPGGRRRRFAKGEESKATALERGTKFPEVSEAISVKGSTSTARGPDPVDEYEFQYKVVEMDDLQTSHQPKTLAKNPKYPAEIQPRGGADRARIEYIKKNFIPDEYLTDRGTLDMGPQIVGTDNALESGNYRTIVLKELAEDDPEKMATYWKRLKERAQEYGINPAELDKFKKPVLVRERLTLVDRTKFAAEANRGAAAAMSEADEAVSAAKAMPDELVALIATPEEVSLEKALAGKENAPFVQKFVEQVPIQLREKFIDAAGNLTAPGARRIADALFAKTYPGEPGRKLLEAFRESADPDLVNVGKGLFASLPRMSGAEAVMKAKGATELAIGDDMAKVVNVLARMKQEGVPIADYLAQGAMWERELSPFQERLLVEVADRARRHTRLRELLNEYAAEVQTEFQQSSMFGQKATKESILERAAAKERARSQAPPPEPELFRKPAPAAAGAPEPVQPAAAVAEAPAAPKAAPEPERPQPARIAEPEGPVATLGEDLGEEVIHEAPLEPIKTTKLPTPEEKRAALEAQLAEREKAQAGEVQRRTLEIEKKRQAEIEAERAEAAARRAKAEAPEAKAVQKELDEERRTAKRLEAAQKEVGVAPEDIQKRFEEIEKMGPAEGQKAVKQLVEDLEAKAAAARKAREPKPPAPVPEDVVKEVQPRLVKPPRREPGAGAEGAKIDTNLPKPPEKPPAEPPARPPGVGGQRPYDLPDPDGEARFQAAKEGLKPKGWIEKAQEAVKNVVMSFGRTFVTLPETAINAPFKEELRKLSHVKERMGGEAWVDVNEILGKAADSPEDFDLFVRKIIADDLVWRNGEGMALPFGLDDTTVGSWQGAVTKAVDENDVVREAVVRHRKIQGDLTEKLRKAVKDVDWNLWKRLENPDYFHHMVLEKYGVERMLAKSGAGEGRLPDTRGQFKRAHGSEKDISANYVQVEMKVLAEMAETVEQAKFVKWLDENESVTEALKQDAKTANQEAFAEIARKDKTIPPQMQDFKRRIKIGSEQMKRAVATGKDPLPPGWDRDQLVELVEKIGKSGDEELVLEWTIEDEEFWRFASAAVKMPGRVGQGAAKLLRAISERREFVKATLGKEFKTWRDLVPKGYREFQPIEGNLLYSASTVSENLAERLFSHQLTELKIGIEDLDKKLVLGPSRKTLVMREDVVNTLEALGKPERENMLSQLFQKIVNRPYKWWLLKAPHRYALYRARNELGNLDKTLAGNPKVLRRTLDAAKEIWRQRGAFWGKQKFEGKLKEFAARGGASAGQLATELGELNFEKLWNGKSVQEALGLPPEQGVKKLFRAVRDFYGGNINAADRAIEAVGRFAAFLEFEDEILRDLARGGKGMPETFAASRPDHVMALSDVGDKAYKLSNEMLVAYDSVSAATRWLAKGPVPFARWQAGNMSSYYRRTANAVRETALALKTGEKLGVRGAKAAYIAGKTFLGFSAASAGFYAWNNLLFPDEEESLSDQERARPHIILGRKSDDDVRVVSGTGSLGDVAQWFGVDAAVPYWDDLMAGRMTLKQYTTLVAKEPFARAGSSLGPSVKIPARLVAVAEERFRRGRKIEFASELEGLADSLGFGWAYDVASGKPTKGVMDAASGVFFRTLEKNQGAYDDIREAKRVFLKKIGRREQTGEPDEKSRALYMARLARHYGDKDAQLKFEREYVKLGGTLSGYKQSLQNMHPMSGMNRQVRQQFYATLSESEKAKLNLAIAYYEETLLGKKYEEAPAAAAPEQAAPAAKPKSKLNELLQQRELQGVR